MEQDLYEDSGEWLTDGFILEVGLREAEALSLFLQW